MTSQVTREGALEVTLYSRSKRVVRLVSCPFCGHSFDDHEPRWKHFLEEHDPDDVPGLSGGPETAADGGQVFVRASRLYDPSDQSLTAFGSEWLDRAQDPSESNESGLIPDGGKDDLEPIYGSSQGLLRSASRELERAAATDGSERRFHIRQALQLLEGVRERDEVEQELRNLEAAVQEGSP